MKSAVIVVSTLVVAAALWTAPGRAFQVREPQPLDASEPIPYYIADGAGRAGFRATDRELAAWALAAWQRHAGGALGLVAAPLEATALVRLYWADAREGQYGEMRPLIVADPMLRAPKPEIEAEEYAVSSAGEMVAQRNSATGKINFNERMNDW